MLYYNKEQMIINYAILKNHYGSHWNVAEELGITPDHYRKIRNNRTGMSTSLRKLIVLLANQIANQVMI